MLPSQVFELADDVRYHSYDDAYDQQELTRIAYAVAFDDNLAYAIHPEDLSHNYVNARHLRREYFG